MQERRLAEYHAQKSVMVFSARAAHDREANSYRNFRVGATILAENEGGDFQPFSAGNFKRRCRNKTAPYHGQEGHVCEAEPRKKCCAERRAIHKAERAGYRYVVAVAVVGDLQEDNESHLQPELLEPCGVCRVAFRRLVRDGRMENDAPIVSAHPNPEYAVGPTEQVLWQLLEKHAEGDAKSARLQRSRGLIEQSESAVSTTGNADRGVV